jgi:hypothetical protein
LTDSHSNTILIFQSSVPEWISRCFYLQSVQKNSEDVSLIYKAIGVWIDEIIDLQITLQELLLLFKETEYYNEFKTLYDQNLNELESTLEQVNKSLVGFNNLTTLVYSNKHTKRPYWTTCASSVRTMMTNKYIKIENYKFKQSMSF